MNRFVLLSSCAAAFVVVEATKSPGQAPGGRPEDVNMAVHSPHEYAWKLFIYVNTQAEAGKAGVPDPKKNVKTYDDNRPVVWETWALASGGRAGGRRSVPNRSEVYLDKGAKPTAWDDLPRTVTSPPKSLEPLTAKRLEFLARNAVITERPSHVLNVFAIDPDKQFRLLSDPTIPERSEELFEGGQPTADEVRVNKTTFNFIRDHRFYSIEGLEAAFNKRDKIEFPAEAQEVKAQWVRIQDKDKPRYHWRLIKGPKGEDQVWGLSGLHIITRDLPNWFWCDFEHADYTPFAELPSDDPTTRGDKAPSKGSAEGVRKELDGSKWQHYRLRGAQIDFADSKGVPTLLANTQIEKGFQQTSSCITCHARASVGLRASDPSANATRTYSLPVFEESAPVPLGSIGYPNRRWFTDDRGRPRFLQTDFLWSMPFRACSETETPPTPPKT